MRDGVSQVMAVRELEAALIYPYVPTARQVRLLAPKMCNPIAARGVSA